MSSTDNANIGKVFNLTGGGKNTSGLFGFEVNADGHLIMTTADEGNPYNFTIGSDGHLYATL